MGRRRTSASADEVFAVESEVAQAVGARRCRRGSPRKSSRVITQPPSANPAAYDAYSSRAGLRRASDRALRPRFARRSRRSTEAVRLDPDFADRLGAALAASRAICFRWHTTAPMRGACWHGRRWKRRGSCAPDLVEVQAARGYFRHRRRREPRGVRRAHFARAPEPRIPASADGDAGLARYCARLGPDGSKQRTCARILALDH